MISSNEPEDEESVNLGYKERYKTNDVVTVWKYAKQPANEHNNEIIYHRAVITGIRELPLYQVGPGVRYEYFVIDRWEPNYMLTPCE